MAQWMRLLWQMEWKALWVILVVLCVRWLLRKLPRRYTYWLWAVVGFRLACPVSFASIFSLLPRSVAAAPQQIGPLVMQNAARPPVTAVQTLPQSSQIAGSAAPVVQAVDPAAIWGWVWLAGVLVLVGYSAISLARLNRQVSLASRWQGNVYRMRGLRSPFVFGLLKPRIYLPVRLDEVSVQMILAHERAHLRRGDHWAKAFAWLLVCVHWFCPVVWVCFFLFEKDMEVSCDETVIRDFDLEQRKMYSAVLLNLAAPRRFVGGCPLAFGENSIAGRIKSILHYRKPAVWLTAATAVLVAVLCVGLAGDPAAEKAGSEPQPSLVPAVTPAPSEEGEASSRPAEQGSYILMYLEGMEEKVLADWYEGEAYSILIPSEGWVMTAPGQWNAEANKAVSFRVVPFAEETAPEIKAVYQKGQTAGIETIVEVPRTDSMTEKVYLTGIGNLMWAVHCVHPAGPEYAEGFGTRMAYIARTLTFYGDAALCAQYPDFKAFCSYLEKQSLDGLMEAMYHVDGAYSEQLASELTSRLLEDPETVFPYLLRQPHAIRQTAASLIVYDLPWIDSIKVADLHAWLINKKNGDTSPEEQMLAQQLLTAWPAVDGADALTVYSAFLSGDTSLLNREDCTMWGLDAWSDVYLALGTLEHTLMDLDGDSVPELLVQWKNDPASYNAVFHYDGSQLRCWQNDASEGNCRDYPLQNGTMVRQYDFNGTTTYTIFRYLSDGQTEEIFHLTAREQKTPDGAPHPYYEAGGKTVEKDIFDQQLQQWVTDLLLRRESWTPV